MYKRTRYFCGSSIEVEERHIGRYGAPGMKRLKREKPTPEQIAKQNQWRKERDIRRLLKINFGEHDYWVTLTYKKDRRPPTIQEAKEQLQKFLRKMRDRYKRMGSALKYIAVIEIGSRGGIHHHVVLNRIEGGDKLVTKYWEHGKPAFRLLYLEGGFRDLANYIAKQTEGEKWYSRSRNLRKPKTDEKILKRKTFSREIRVPKGYYLEKDSVREGINPVNGHPYRHYTLNEVRRC